MGCIYISVRRFLFLRQSGWCNIASYNLAVELLAGTTDLKCDQCVRSSWSCHMRYLPFGMRYAYLNKVEKFIEVTRKTVLINTVSKSFNLPVIVTYWCFSLLSSLLRLFTRWFPLWWRCLRMRAHLRNAQTRSSGRWTQIEMVSLPQAVFQSAAVSSWNWSFFKAFNWIELKHLFRLKQWLLHSWISPVIINKALKLISVNFEVLIAINILLLFIFRLCFCQACLCQSPHFCCKTI